MKKLYYLLIVMIGLGMSVSYAQLTEDESEDEYFELLFEGTEIIQGVSKKNESFSQVPMSVYVVSNEELNSWGVRNIYEVFQRVPGYSFYNTDYYGQYGPIGRGLSSVWRYGFSFELMNVVDFGHMTFSPHFFKNIEMARGPAGLMWGSGAEAGLLNFNIRDDLEGLEAIAELGNEGRQTYDLLYGGKFNDEGDGFFIGWHWEEQDAVSQDNAFDLPGEEWKMNGVAPSQCLVGKVKYEDIKLVFFQDHAKHVAPKIWFTDQYRALQSALDPIQDEVGDNMEILAYRLEYHVPTTPDNVNLYFYHDYYKKQWWFESLALDTQRKRSVGFNADISLFEDALDLSIGSNIWGEDQNTAPSHTTEFARPYGITWYDSSYLAQDTEWRDMFVQAKYNFSDSFAALVGGRWDYQKDAEDEDLFTGPRVGLFFAASESLNFKYLFNTTNRRPQGNEAAQGLSYEELEAHELITSVNLSNTLKLNVTLFVQELSDQITRQNVTNSLNAFVNTGGVESKGVEWDLKYMPFDNMIFYWNGTYLDAEVSEGSVNGQTVSDPNIDGKPVFVPEITSFAGIEAQISSLLKVNVAVRSILNIPYFDVNNNEDEASVSFVDLTLSSKKFFDERMDISVAALNLLDEDERVPAFGEHAGNTNGTIQPEGTRWFVKVRMNF